jgi:hypothetical protein
MPSQALAEIESRLPLLSAEEQLFLVERLARDLRRAARPQITDEDLAALAADPNIQRELKAIEEEFAPTELDGLERL